MTPRSGTGAARKILVIGGTGQIGWELVRSLAPHGDVVAPGRAELDLGAPAQVRDFVRELRPAVVVNAAGYTAVDAAERDPETARALNEVAPGVLAEVCAATDALLVHYSTDYVFDGSSQRPYREDDPTAPLNVYGRTKLQGELAVLAAAGRHLVLRTSWVYGLRGSNFLRTILKAARERDELRVVDDQIGSPTWARMVADGTAALLPTVLRSDLRGVFHLAAAGSTSWYGFARLILALDAARAEQRCRTVVPIGSGEYPAAARRPHNSVLDGGRLAEHGIRLPAWERQLELCLAQG